MPISEMSFHPEHKRRVLGIGMVTKKNRADLDLDFGAAST